MKTLKVFCALSVTFLLIPWCFAVPPATLIIGPLYFKILKGILLAGHR